MDSNEYAVIEQALNRIKKNPHAIDKYDAEKLFDLMTALNQKYERFAEMFISTWELNKDSNFKGQDLETALKRQSVVKNINKLYSIIETEYNKRINKDIIGIKPLTLQNHATIREKYKLVFEDLKNRIDKTGTIEDRIYEWEKELIKFNSDVKNDISTMVTSGQMIEAINDKTPLYLDDYINKEIELLRLDLNKTKKDAAQETTLTGPEIDFDVTAALKICLLKELGVIDRLAEKGLAANKMAQLIKFLTKEPIKTGAVNVTLSRIHNEGLMEKYQSEIAALKLKFGITQ